MGAALEYIRFYIALKYLSWLKPDLKEHQLPLRSNLYAQQPSNLSQTQPYQEDS